MNVSGEVIQQGLKVIKQSEEMEKKTENIVHEMVLNTQQITDKSSTAIVPISDATLTVVQKVFTGGALVFGGDAIIQLLTTDSSSLLDSRI